MDFNPDLNTAALLPEILLAVAGILLMLAIPILSSRRQVRLGYAASLILAAALIVVLLQWDHRGPAFFGMVSVDPLGGAARILFLVSSAAVALISVSYLKRERLRHGEYFPLLLLATVGMSLMAVSADLIMTFLGLEILSISSYVLAGYRRGDPRSNESALKYFLLGAFSTAFMLYGIALLYGAAGSTKYSAIAEAAAGGQAETATFLLGLGLLLVGFGFKAALAPLHVWTPDVYQGPPFPSPPTWRWAPRRRS